MHQRTIDRFQVGQSLRGHDNGQASLARAYGRTVTLSAKVDPAIIGGVVTRIGSTIYDGSVTRQLQRMKEKLSWT